MAAVAMITFIPIGSYEIRCDFDRQTLNLYLFPNVIINSDGGSEKRGCMFRPNAKKNALD